MNDEVLNDESSLRLSDNVVAKIKAELADKYEILSSTTPNPANLDSLLKIATIQGEIRALREMIENHDNSPN